MKIIASSKLKAHIFLGTSLFLIASVLIAGFNIFLKNPALDASLNQNKTITVIIDPGHGGMDGGTQSADGVLEKDINLDIALKLRDILESMEIKTIMTRETDISIHSSGVEGIRNQKISDIKNRLSIIESTENAVFVSIHQNYFTQAKYSGAQVFYSKNNPKSSTLAQCVRNSIISNLQKENTRETKASGSEIFLLNNTSAPAVMVECGFLSNKDEADLLNNEKYRSKMAFFIAMGIADFLNTTEET